MAFFLTFSVFKSLSTFGNHYWTLFDESMKHITCITPKLLIVSAWACLLPSCMTSDLNVAYQVRPVFNGKSLYTHNSAKLCFTHRTHVRVTYLYGMGHNGTGCTLWYRTYLNGMGHTSTLQERPQWHETYLYGTGQHTSTVRCIPLWYRTTDLHGTVHTSMVQDTSLQYRTYLYGVGHTSTVQEEPPQYGKNLYSTGQTSTVRDISLWYRTTNLCGTGHTSTVQDIPLQDRTCLYSMGRTYGMGNSPIPLQYSTVHTSTVKDIPIQFKDYVNRVWGHAVTSCEACHVLVF